MQAPDLDIPAGYRHWQGDPAEDHIGPFFLRPAAHGVETVFRLQPHNCNSHGTAHGGVLMTFIDYTLCVAAAHDTGEKVVTVSCNSEFIDGAAAGSRLFGRGEVIRRTGSLVFTRGTIETADGRVVLAASAVVKRIRR
jgi:uncharacterized protein (TIGR00369 family)